MSWANHFPFTKNAVIGTILNLALLLIAVLLSTVGNAVPASAKSQAPTLYLSKVIGPVSLGPHLEILKDSEKNITIEQVVTGQVSQRFLPLKSDTFFLDDSKANWWIKAALSISEVPEQLPHHWVIDAGWPEFWDWYAVKVFDVYLADSNGNIRLQRAFGKNEFSLFISPFVHQLQFPEPGDYTLFIRVRSDLPVFLPLVTNTVGSYMHSFRKVSMIKALVCGVLLAMAFIHFVLYLCIRDDAYVWYSGFILTLVLYLTVQTGLMREYVPALWSAGLGQYLDPALLTLFSIVFLQFARIYLASRIYAPNHDRLSLIIIWSGVCWLGILPFLNVSLVNTVTLAYPMFCIYSMLIAIVTMRKGFYPARHFIFAFSPYILGGPTVLLAYMGIFEYSSFLFYLLPLVSMISVLLFPYALTRRLGHLRIDQGQIQRKKQATSQRAMTDSLTGLPNARLFQRDLVQFTRRTDQQGESLSLAIFDVDDFKQLNHEHGPMVGDEVLKAMGRIIRVAIRDSDKAYRYGGEEFCLLLPGSTVHEGAAICERIRESLQNLKFASDSERLAKVTISTGIAEYSTAEGPDSLLFRASRAMYRAKADGKDTVVVAV
ncbi:sensor domain-containing diguanylate cyclase [Desulfovibrio ferrophilus]|uniref:diguanylate cyclase n=1 Tax=Desulfovibrio ferrophilus TaxID=241368 RepID=A0A2Z6AWS0_9BACT|nr:diguanylate cyclase [Desulfovibrio ferrophilus]BBD07699.1 7TM domain sensor diguanylate cyclase [Desulfovibrio ferrophilus]